MSRPNETRVLHTNFVLKRESDVSGEIKSYKVRLVLCGSGEYVIEEETFSPVPDFTVRNFDHLYRPAKRVPP